MLLAILERWKRLVLVQLFTVYLRYLIGSAFIIAAIAMGKLTGTSNLLNSNSQSICDLQPIQQFFRVMSDSGLYWKFIGWTQIVAGVLLITQRFARIGALIFFGMILNIFVITVAYDFKGTPVVTGLMLMAVIYLLIWDANSLQYLFRKPGETPALTNGERAMHEHPFWAMLGVCLISVMATMMWLKINPMIVMAGTLIMGMVGLLLFFLVFFRRQRHLNHISIPKEPHQA